MEYILGPKGEGACIFCGFAQAEPRDFRRELVLLVQDEALVCLNRYPYAPSHLLVAPRMHVAEPGDLGPGAYDATMRLLREATVRLREATRCQGMNVGFNVGVAAGAGIADHLHAHVVPRWSGDNNFMPVLSDVRVMPEHLDASWARLAPLFRDLPGQHPEGV
jgi:ATP adenylyltransferase